AGNISIDVRDSVSLVGESAINSSLVIGGTGKSGDITIKANSLSLANSARLQANTIGKGDAGNIYVHVDDFVSLKDNTIPNISTQIRTSVDPGGVGKVGTIDIQARSLSITGGAQLLAEVFRPVGRSPGGQSQGGGNIKIKADSVELSGSGNGLSSGLVTATEEGAIGPAGNITVNTDTFRIADGAIVSAQTFNQSDGGNVTINATTFEAVNGGQILTTTSSSGKAGTITVNADRITLSGSDSTFADRKEKAKFGDRVQNEGSASGLFASTRTGSTGQGGNIAIATGDLIVRDGAAVSVSNLGSGDAGNLDITARSISLDQGNLTARSNSGEGGNINLGVQDLLLLRNNSQISTTAGNNQTGGGNGGSINIKAGFIIAPPGENSDITANAFKGKGGNVDINAQGIFGIEFRPDLTDPQDNQTNDITATSERGPQGTVAINQPDVTPQVGLVELPENVVDVAGLVVQNVCVAKTDQGSELTVTGRGGLPDSPNTALRTDDTWEDWRITQPDKS
ncbi:MAG: hypothetical protein ACRDEA_09240, partial [Microcystaceae cyanobacterium]